MPDINYQLRSLRVALAQEEDILAVISDTHNHAEVKGRVDRLKTDIKKLEDFERKQNIIRVQNGTSDSGLKCGEDEV